MRIDWIQRCAGTAVLAAALLGITGCGYHEVGGGHLPKSVQTLAVPIFTNRSQAYHTEVDLTQAVVQQMTDRTQLSILATNNTSEADAVLSGVVLDETVVPLTYNSRTGQSSSFLVTITAAVKLLDRHNRVLYENPNYQFRQQYQSTSDLPSFLQEDRAAINRLSQDFARALVGDILESF